MDGWMDVWWMITSWTIMDGREHPTGWMMMEASKGKSGLVWRCLWFLDLRFCACRHGRAATACPHSSLQLSCLSSSSSPSTHFFVCFFVCLSFSSAAAHLLLDLRCRTAPLRCLLQRSVARFSSLIIISRIFAIALGLVVFFPFSLTLLSFILPFRGFSEIFKSVVESPFFCPLFGVEFFLYLFLTASRNLRIFSFSSHHYWGALGISRRYSSSHLLDWVLVRLLLSLSFAFFFSLPFCILWYPGR